MFRTPDVLATTEAIDVEDLFGGAGVLLRCLRLGTGTVFLHGDASGSGLLHHAA